MTLETLIKNNQQAQKLLNHFGFNNLSDLQNWAIKNQDYFTEQCIDIDLDIDLNEPVKVENEPVKVEPKEQIEQNHNLKNDAKKSK